MRTEKVIVTGATGFIGSHLVRRLVKEGFIVHILCRHSSNFWRIEELLPQITRHIASLEEAERLREIMTNVQPDYIFHLASSTVVAGSSGADAELTKTNLLGTVNLIKASQTIEYRGLVTTGDSFEYTTSHLPLSEADPCYPNTLHGITQLAATLYAQAMATKDSSPITTLRLFSTYGANDNPRRLIPKVISSALVNAPLSLSRPEIARDWIYIDDLVELYLEAAFRAKELAGGVFNAGTGKQTNLGEVVNTILALTASSSETNWGVFSAPAHDAYPWVADTSKTFEHFTWRPRRSFEEGIRAMITAMSGLVGI